MRIRLDLVVEGGLPLPVEVVGDAVIELRRWFVLLEHGSEYFVVEVWCAAHFDGGFVDVFLTHGGGPFDGAELVDVSVGPSGEGFQFVVVHAEVGQVVERGAPVVARPFDAGPR